MIVSPKLSGRDNMKLDIGRFNAFEAGNASSSLRIYSWRPKCISLGYSQIIEREIDEVKACELGWDILKRPTGGGIVFHNEAEVTYSLVTSFDDPVLPKGLVPSYKKISEAVAFGLKKLGVMAEIGDRKSEAKGPVLCFSYPAEYEIVADGKKIVGSAQKRGKIALLQQGSIFVRKTDESALSLLKKPHENLNAVSVEEVLDREVPFVELSGALVKGFKEILSIEFDE